MIPLMEGLRAPAARTDSEIAAAVAYTRALARHRAPQALEENMPIPDDVRALLADRSSPDRERAFEALTALFRLAEEPVDWAYAVWDDLLDQLSDPKGGTRAFAAQMLARLAISDPDGRMLEDFPRVAAVMNDEKTVTARHTLQTLWRVGLAGAEQKAMAVEALEARYRESPGGKKGRIVRRDVITALGRLAKATGDETVEARARALMAAEEDAKEAEKQQAAWRATAK